MKMAGSKYTPGSAGQIPVQELLVPLLDDVSLPEFGPGPILVGVDGSKSAARACSWAAALAAAAGRSLIVAHAYSVGDFRGGPDVAAQSSRDEVARWLTAIETGGLSEQQVEIIVASGDAGSALVRMAMASNASLLVHGAGHVGAISQHGLGRTTQHTTFRSPSPVAVVRGSGGPVAKAPLVVGIDPADLNVAAISWSFALARVLGSPLEVVVVSDDAKAVDIVERLLEQLVRPDGPIVELYPTEGDPADELMNRAADIEASAVMVGQKRHHNLHGRVLGHVPSKLLYQSRRPVVVLPHP